MISTKPMWRCLHHLTVDGKQYATVGVRFRGNTSTGFVSAGFKKSLNISVDYDDEDQRLYGYKTLNLLNAHGDPTLMREVLFSRIASDYMPALKANYMRVVINGENWGLYVNSQQFDKIFLNEAFDTKGGIRWKKPADPRQGGGLKYDGDSAADYKGFYQLKTNVDSEEEQEAWDHYIQFAKTLATAPVDQLEEALEPYLDIDQALWFLAMENTFIDADGYWVRASDFNFYQDPNGRFHIISHDNNETFRKPGGRGFNGGMFRGLN
jgi:spore coat protein CotH